MNYRNQSADNASCGCNSQMQYGNMQGMPPIPPMQPMPPYTPMGTAPRQVNENYNSNNRNTNRNGEVKEATDCLANMPIAMAYVPWQQFRNLYNQKDAFAQGTMFKELDLDFQERRCN